MLTKNQLSEIEFMTARNRFDTKMELLREQLEEHGPEKVGQERWNNLMEIAIDGTMLVRESRHLEDEVRKLRREVNRFLEEETKRLLNARNPQETT